MCVKTKHVSRVYHLLMTIPSNGIVRSIFSHHKLGTCHTK
uniref:Uncharacterized protein n=1 Tax=Anguilla anguilla TaxID=7936 RepID=A0A0E9XJC8_ANGAN